MCLNIHASAKLCLINVIMTWLILFLECLGLGEEDEYWNDPENENTVMNFRFQMCYEFHDHVLAFLERICL